MLPIAEVARPTIWDDEILAGWTAASAQGKIVITIWGATCGGQQPA